jgi:hypothetical protein
MKRIIFVVFIFLILFFPDLKSQQILNIIENERDSKKHANLVNNRIIDINSILNIEVNDDSLIKKISDIYGDQLPKELSQKISAISRIMKSRNEMLRKIDGILRTYNNEEFRLDPQKNRQFSDTLTKVVAVLNDIVNLDPSIEQRFRENNEGDAMYSGVFQAAEEFMNNISNIIRQFADDNGFKVQFGGFLYTKNTYIPVHLPGFDQIKPQSPYEVERWQFLPTEEQIKELKQIQDYAKENKEIGTNILLQMAQNQLEVIKSFAELNLTLLWNDITKQFDQKVQTLGGVLNEEQKKMINEILDIQSDFNKTKSSVDSILPFYKNMIILKNYDLAGFLDHAQRDIEFLINSRLKDLSSKINHLLKDIQTSDFTDFTKNMENLRSEVTVKKELLESTIKKKASEFLYGKEFDISALEFGNDVYQQTITNLPNSTVLDMLTVGVRHDGDRLLLKLILKVKGSSEDLLLESRDIYMFNILPHVTSTVGVIFADPLEITNVKTQFQMAPCFQVLFKGIGDRNIRRSSITYNRMFDWGFGINICSPDFNMDNIPEIGIGAVISALHDYVSAGLGFNVFDGAPYWFFGIRLPIPSFQLGNLNTTAPENVNN